MVKIVTTSAADAEQAATLIHATAPAIWSYLFRQHEDFNAYAQGLWQAKQNNFSFSECVGVYQNQKLVAMELGYRGQDEYQLRKAGNEIVPKVVLQGELEYLLVQAEHIDYLTPYIPKSAYYLHFLSVDPQAKGQGLGGKLLLNAQARAQALGCRSIHLDVYVDNPAIAIYQHYGFSKIVRTEFPNKLGLPSLYRMEKLL